MAEQTIGIYRVRNVAHMQSKKLEFDIVHSNFLIQNYSFYNFKLPGKCFIPLKSRKIENEKFGLDEDPVLWHTLQIEK